MDATMTTTLKENDTPGPGDGCAVETFGLTKRFGERTAVDGVDLHIPRGIAFGYLGSNVSRTLFR